MASRSKSDPYMPLFIRDYRADTNHLNTAEEHGAYLLLIMEAFHSKKPLPDDDEALASIAKMPLRSWLKISKKIRAFFRPHTHMDESLLVHERVALELGIAASKSLKRKEAADARWMQMHPKPDANGMQSPVQDTGTGYSSMHTSVPDTTLSESSQRLVLDIDVLPISKKTKSPPARGTRWVKGRVVPESWIDDVHRKHSAAGLTLDEARLQAEKFAEYWPTQPGAKGLKLDWELTFHVWIRNSFNRPAFGARQPRSSGSITDGLQFVLDRIKDGD